MRKAITALGAAVMAALTLRWLMRPREEIDWRDAEAPGRTVTVDGVGIHYVERGRGPDAVVLIHGFGGHTYSFRYLIPDLARYHRVVAVDLKGFGYSERPQKSDYSLSSQACLVVYLMDMLAIDQASLVGHSMGGEVAMRVAAGWPQRVDKLVLAASVSGERIPSLPVTPLIKPMLSLFVRLFGRWLFRRMFYDRRNATEEALEAYRAPARICGSRDATYQVIRDFRRDKRVAFERTSALGTFCSKSSRSNATPPSAVSLPATRSLRPFPKPLTAPRRGRRLTAQMFARAHPQRRTHLPAHPEVSKACPERSRRE